MRRLNTTVVGARRPRQILTWLRERSTTPVDLTGATLTGVIREQRTGAERAITGPLVVEAAADGAFGWAPSDVDVATIGQHRVRFIATYGDGTAEKTFWADWDVER